MQRINLPEWVAERSAELDFDKKYKYKAVENAPENLGIGYMYFMHTNLTPVIEVAGDGKTAKGIWSSLGLNVLPDVNEEGKTTITTKWAPEKYAVDFVKEDGEWKIWHFVNIFEPGPVDGSEVYPREDKMYKNPPGAKGGFLLLL